VLCRLVSEPCLGQRKWVRRSKITFIRWHVIAIAFVLVSGCATGGTSVFYRTPGSELLTVPATLTLPEKHTGRVPAVVIVHGSGGVDGRGAYHGVALNAAGIATFEIDMWAPRGLRGVRAVAPVGSPKRCPTPTAHSST
jgi:hypothetical protein